MKTLPVNTKRYVIVIRFKHQCIKPKDIISHGGIDKFAFKCYRYSFIVTFRMSVHAFIEKILLRNNNLKLKLISLTHLETEIFMKRVVVKIF